MTRSITSDISTYIDGTGKIVWGVHETTSNEAMHINYLEAAVYGPPDDPPAAPTGLIATGGNEIVWLDWDDNTEGDLDGYNVYRSTTSGSGYSQINGSLLSSSDYTDSSVTNGITYYYVVTAVDTALQESGYSNEDPATPKIPGTDVEIIGNWATDLSHAEEAGNSRALIFIAHVEHSGTIDLTSVAYGGQAMAQVIERTTGGTGYQAYVTAYILDEAGIAAASGNTFVPTWTTTPENVSYASVFLQNVNQTSPVGATASNSTTSSTPNPITTDPLATEDGDMVIDAAVCGNTGDYTLLNGFTEALEHDMSSSTGADGYKSATGADETPSAQHSSANRQAIIGFVVQAMSGTPIDDPPAAPTGLVATAGNDLVSLDWNDNSETDLAGYNVYRSTYSGGGYSQINVSLVVDSDYVDNDVNNFTPYYYVVTAIDANDNESGYSNQDLATPDYQNCAQVQAGGDGLVSDLTGDCYVDLHDLDIVANYWLDTDCGSSGNCQGADFAPTDGDVDLEDFSDFAVDWMLCNNPGDSGCIENWRPTE